VGPRGAGGATQEGAGRTGGERHGGFVCVWLGEEAGDAGRDGTGREWRKRAEEAKIWCGGGQPQPQRAAQIRGGLEAGLLEHFRVGLSGPQ